MGIINERNNKDIEPSRKRAANRLRVNSPPNSCTLPGLRNRPGPRHVIPTVLKVRIATRQHGPPRGSGLPTGPHPL